MQPEKLDVQELKRDQTVVHLKIFLHSRLINPETRILSVANQRVHIFVKGKVQGVFFRQTTKTVAEKKNVTGWVRNLKDGRVEAILEGQNVAVSEVVEWSHRGPTNAIVEDVQIVIEKYKGEFSKFDILY